MYHCFYSAVEESGKGFRIYLDRIVSRDLQSWSQPERLLSSPLGFSSPGNVLPVENGFVLCLQSYPIPEGETYADGRCRLWLLDSPDLERFGQPRCIAPDGCTARWARTARQIDPYLIRGKDAFYLLYKTDGCLGLLRSEDLQHFEEASPRRPILSPEDTPDGSTVENPCVLLLDGVYYLFFSPCRAGRGIGLATSRDLLHWEGVAYLDFPSLPWAPGGPTAPMVLDDRPRSGRWRMFFHGDIEGAHKAALGQAVSEDLLHWEVV